LFAEEFADLWERWRRVLDELFEIEESVDAVCDEQRKRQPREAYSSDQQTPAEVALRVHLIRL